jgi:hypothetical protein
VFDPWGKPITDAQIEFLTSDRSKNLASSPHARVISDVPYGRYRLVAKITGGYASERQILVNAKSMFVMTSIPFRWGDSTMWEGGSLELIGTVAPVPPEPTFIRIRGLYLDDQREAILDRMGKFYVGGLDNGSFVIEVLSGTRLIHAESISIDQREQTHRIAIKLPRAPNR